MPTTSKASHSPTINWRPARRGSQSSTISNNWTIIYKRIKQLKILHITNGKQLYSTKPIISIKCCSNVGVLILQAML